MPRPATVEELQAITDRAPGAGSAAAQRRLATVSLLFQPTVYKLGGLASRRACWSDRTPIHLSSYVMWRLNWIHPKRITKSTHPDARFDFNSIRKELGLPL